MNYPIKCEHPVVTRYVTFVYPDEMPEALYWLAVWYISNYPNENEYRHYFESINLWFDQLNYDERMEAIWHMNEWS